MKKPNDQNTHNGATHADDKAHTSATNHNTPVISRFEPVTPGSTGKQPSTSPRQKDDKKATMHAAKGDDDVMSQPQKSS